MDDEARFLDHLHIVKRVVARYLHRIPSSVSADDLASAARTALWWTVINYRDLSPEEFERYAWTRVRGSVIDELRHSSWYSRRKKYSPVTLVRDPSWFPEPPSPDDPADVALETAEKWGRIREAISALGGRDARIFDMYYVRGMKMLDVARELGVTQARVSQLHKQLISRLKAAVAAQTMPPPAEV